MRGSGNTREEAMQLATEFLEGKRDVASMEAAGVQVGPPITLGPSDLALQREFVAAEALGSRDLARTYGCTFLNLRVPAEPPPWWKFW